MRWLRKNFRPISPTNRALARISRLPSPNRSTVQPPNGTRAGGKRKGLTLTLTIMTNKGEGLMRRLDVSKDPVVMLNATPREAAKAAGVELKITETEILIAA